MKDDLEKIIITRREIDAEVAKAAKWLDARFGGTFPLAISVLKGSVMFFCDLVRAMETPVQFDFMTVSSYGSGTESSGTPKITMDLSASVEGRDVILVEDIVDSGLTLSALRDVILGRGAKSFTSVALFNKEARRRTDIHADYACFEIGDEFIVGYGLDYDQRYRNLPCVGVLKRSVYER